MFVRKSVKPLVPAIFKSFKLSISERSGPEVIKLFSMLNSAEHEIYPTHKC